MLTLTLGGEAGPGAIASEADVAEMIPRRIGPLPSVGGTGSGSRHGSPRRGGARRAALWPARQQAKVTSLGTLLNARIHACMIVAAVHTLRMVWSQSSL